MKTLTIELTNVEYVLIVERDEDMRENDLEFEQDKDAFRECGAVSYTLVLEGELPNGNSFDMELDSCGGFIDTDDVLDSMKEHYCQYVQEDDKVRVVYR